MINNRNLVDSKFKSASYGYAGQSNYHTDFEFPNIEVSFHWWENRTVGFHDHNHYEIFLITEGKIYHTINGVKSILARGEMIFVRPYDCHSFDLVNKSNCRHLNLGFTENKFIDLCKVLSGSSLQFDNTPIKLTDRELDYFLSNVNQLNLVKKASETYVQSYAVIAVEMITEALCTFHKRRLISKTEYPDWFNTLLQRLHQPEALNYTSSDIYRLSNYSPSVLLKYFRDYTGETIVSYCTKIRVNFACNMLKTTNFTIADISTRVGYGSISHFTKVFKKHTGMTPKEFKHYA